ncbi:MAG: prolyl oligopeptidase family serine peptidase, partial [Sciscionella sp.]
MRTDPHLWLEDITGARQLEWVRGHNAATDAELALEPGFGGLETRLRAVLDSTAKIPGVIRRGYFYYNFWQDAEHERGLWRRTTLQEYRKPDPAWEILLDLDALAAAESEPWVWHGAQLLRPDYQRALVALSRGGSDADETREFDLTTLAWVPGGFRRPAAKGELAWIDLDHVFVATDFGAGSMTTSGYPRLVKEWTRGTPLADAVDVYAAEPADLAVTAWHDDAPGFERDLVQRGITFFTDQLLWRTGSHLVTIDVPDSARKSVHRRWLTIVLREPWTVAGTTYAAGSLLTADLDAYVAGRRELFVAFEPTATTALVECTWTRDHLVLTVLDNVTTRLSVATWQGSRWQHARLPGGPTMGSAAVAAVEANDSNDVWVYATGFLTPTTLSLAPVGDDRPPEQLKTNPEFFDAAHRVVEQHFATSADGTAIPYFLIRPTDLAFDGSAATLVTGYGGFEVPLTPEYLRLAGPAWVSWGGVYVVANIRGGGEYGPRWHQAALRENRHRAYED